MSNHVELKKKMSTAHRDHSIKTDEVRCFTKVRVCEYRGREKCVWHTYDEKYSVVNLRMIEVNYTAS